MAVRQQQQFEAEVADFSPGVRGALADLQQAHEYARRLRHDRWEFAVEFQYLAALGRRSATCAFS